MQLSEVTIRPIKPGEVVQMEDFLYLAVYQPEPRKIPKEEILQRPDIAVYIRDWGRHDDYCLVAESGNQIIGVAWARLFSADAKGFGYIDPHTPELSIALRKGYRGMGIGKMLINALHTLLAEKGFAQVSLSVHIHNPAYRFYQSLGYKTKKETSHDYVMALLFRS